MNKIMGHLMLDEIKLKNGITYKCNSNKVLGFLPDYMDTKNLHQNILDKSKKKKDVTRKNSNKFLC